MLSVSIQSFAYSEKEILKDISFQLEKGEHLAVLGESGCGKSSLLHIIYGLLHLEHGILSWKDKKLLGPTHNLIPGESFIKLVAQEYNVMPYTTVSENIGTHLSRFDMEKDSARISELLKVVDLQEFAETKVKNLSGGQKQRVALAKALANKPELLLLDEPFSNIDTFRKNKLRRNLYNYLKENEISCITATHDSDEALAFSDYLLILKDGTVDAFGTPEYVYKNVSTPYQAGFFDEITVLPARLLNVESSKELLLFPHQLKVSIAKTKLQITVKNSYFKGSYFLIEGRYNETSVFFEHHEHLLRGSVIQLQKK
ncbi:ABC-type Fe3+/spermidine/putrescine transport system ATPase subunit [Ulvibacter sp. MAR_2010_11]|uniref:ABC transporter ATP-binding protein n=1 Tax=Ulvibacter sp. MAR_2010_11 TaxID=1250229 RepID=UPI000C2C4A3F|nr:ABC transporter ATP-binding protein [Ulvibacter sp. MAR_2010_11]PKA82980.1 ABC-type Fe3+/spermidine/putrescine transport system ATPase subunit [Ulvibacter sp. MAR_2010_11]